VSSSSRVRFWRGFAFVAGVDFLFGPSAYDEVIQWQPVPWHIPRSNELSALEALITGSANPGHWNRAEEDLGRDYSSGIWYFFATALAIQFLQRISSCGLHLCNVVIHEDFKAVAHPAHHAQGLIPFCQANPHLRIERQIGYWSSMFPYAWPHLDKPGVHFITIGKDTHCDTILQAMVDWICTTEHLAQLGMPAHSCSTVFDARSEDEQQVWALVKRAAFWQESMQEWITSSCESPPRHNEEPDFTRWPYPVPCNLPEAFARAVRSITEGTPYARCLGFVGDMSEGDALDHGWREQKWE
jgi:hypothetical protein